MNYSSAATSVWIDYLDSGRMDERLYRFLFVYYKNQMTEIANNILRGVEKGIGMDELLLSGEVGLDFAIRNYIPLESNNVEDFVSKAVKSVIFTALHNSDDPASFMRAVENIQQDPIQELEKYSGHLRRKHIASEM